MQIPSVLANVQTFENLFFITKKSTAHLSFWGCRYITVKGYDGYLELDALVSKVEELIARKLPWDNETRNSGKLVVNEIKRIYSGYIRQKRNCNWITWIFLLVRAGFIWEKGSHQRTYFYLKIVPLFNVRRLEFIGDAEYDPAKNFKYLRVREYLDYHSPNWMPDPAHVEITNDPEIFLEDGVTVPFNWS